MKILIADDNRTNLKLLHAVLHAEGHDVVEAIDGEEALAVLGREVVDAVISDILMPKVDGYRLCYEIRRNQRTHDLPIVIYTATYTSPADEKLCLDLGANQYIRKPASTSQLIAAIRDAVDGPHNQPLEILSATDVLREYSERLVDKLEERNIELIRRTEELAASQLQLHNLLAHSPAVLYALQVDGDRLTPTIVSDNIERLLGIQGENTNYEWWMDSLHPDDRDRVLAMPKHCQDSDESTMEYRIRHADGSYRWIEDSSRILRDETGAVSKIVGVWMDVTDRKLVEEELKQTLDRLEIKVQERTAALAQTVEQLKWAKETADSANRSKSEFLSRMSHELRTPMNSILGFGQLLEFSKLDEQQAESVDHILKAGRHLLTLINEVLEISRIEAGSIAISLEPVAVAEVLDEAISLMKPVARERGVALEVLSKPTTLVKADRQRLRQVLLNLISNAIKYNVDGGKVILGVVDDSSGTTTVEIHDTGRGIPPSMIGRLFTPFDRLAADASGIEGTGLGLALSKSLTNAMGGDLTFVTEQGVGSCFRVTLTKVDESEITERSTSPLGFDSEVWGDAKGRILVIEDNSMNARLLERLFADYPQIELVTTMQGRLGLELATDQPPDAILLDMHLPDMNGKEVLSALKANIKLREIPVIIITADAFSGQSQDLLQSGAFRYLTKPFILSELISAVKAALNKEERIDSNAI